MSLQDALNAYRGGDLDGAADALDEVLDADPGNADALMLAGLVANRRGDLQVALTLFDRAVAADPEHDAAWTNRAHPLAALGRLDQAEQSVREALALRTSPQAASLLLRILLAAGRADAAARDGEHLLVELPDDGLLALLTGQALLLSGRPAEALRPLTLALQTGRGQAAPLLVRAVRDKGDPAGALVLLDKLGLDDADARNLRGTLHLASGALPQAEQAFRGALELDPSHGAAHHNLASVLHRQGRSEQALPHHRAALQAQPDDHARWVGLVDSLARCATVPSAAQELIVAALERPFLAHQGLERAARHTASRHPDVARLLAGEPLDSAMLDALDTPLVHAWWQRTRVLGPEWERALTRLRRAHLLDQALSDHPAVALSLAVQAWHTEHAWWVAPDEQERLQDLSAQDHAVTWTLYRAWPADRPARALPPVLRHLHVDAPALEAHLAQSLPTLGLTDDDTSQAVRAQYEAHPYPRLLSVHRKPPASLPSLLGALLPHVSDEPDPHPCRVLIAGCGTGQQVLGASRYADADILAVDLSRASLGVAARQVRAWELQDRVRLAQADLLALGSLDERFHVIECGGVLHHLADPLAGWRVLTGLLAPGGLMKIALYAERARQDVLAARELVQDLPLTPDGLRASRRRLLDLPADHPAHSVLWSPDFASLSGFRDLVRHSCEHRFTLPQLDRALRDLDLEFLGFQHPDPRAAALYRQRFPDDPEQRDLERWELIEAEHPEIFAGMYQLWCRGG